jgi:hypothetical protein
MMIMIVKETEKKDRKIRKLLTIEGNHHSKADINRPYLKRPNGGCGLVKLESIYNTIAGLSEYNKQGKDRLTILVKEYNARETKYSL